MTVAKMNVLVELEAISIQRWKEVAAELHTLYGHDAVSTEELRCNGIANVELYVLDLSSTVEVDSAFIERLGKVVSGLGEAISVTLEAGDGQPSMTMPSAVAARRFKPVADLLKFGSDYRVELLGPTPSQVDEVDASITLNGQPATARQVEGLNLRVDNLSRRTANILGHESLEYLAQVVTWTDEALLMVPNFARRSLNDLKQVLGLYGLTTQMTVTGWTPPKAG